MLGVPTDVEKKDGSPGEDTIQFNAHRSQCSFSITERFFGFRTILRKDMDLYEQKFSGFMDPDFTLTSLPTGNLSGQIQEKGKSSIFTNDWFLNLFASQLLTHKAL